MQTIDIQEQQIRYKELYAALLQRSILDLWSDVAKRRQNSEDWFNGKDLGGITFDEVMELLDLDKESFLKSIRRLETRPCIRRLIGGHGRHINSDKRSLPDVSYSYYHHPMSFSIR